MNLRITGAILRKDILSLLPLVSVTVALFAADIFVTRLELLPLWWSFRVPVLQLAFAVLTLSLFQLDSPASLVDDWLCRPVPRAELLAAKLTLLLTATYLAPALAIFACDLGQGASLLESLQDALFLQDAALPLLAPLLLFIALVTRTLVQGLGLLIAIFIAVFVIPTPLVREPGPLEPGIRDALPAVGLDWLLITPATWLAMGLLILAAWLVYWRRRLQVARLLLAVMVLATLLLALLPMWLLPFESTFAVQSAAAPPRQAAATGSIYLRHPRACLPATRIQDLATDAAFAAIRKASGVETWNSDQLEKLAPGDLAFLTAIELRGLPLDWRVKLNYVQADYSSSQGSPRYSLRPARYNTDAGGGETLSHAWALPEAAVRELSGATGSQLDLHYFLTLLEPRAHRLPVDGRRHALPGLGYCSARRASGASRIDVDCFSGVSDLAQVSAELEKIPATRVYGPLNLAPRWTRWLHGQHVQLSLGSARLSQRASITMTAWTVGGYARKSLQLPGVLGATPDTCPLPSGESKRFQEAVWRDAAAHETSSIGVADGVQLEVLDFGGTGSPIVLLPGLGATAHSFDEFAPLLARQHRVIAITRRGTGYSSKPDFGYDTAQLSADVLHVMDALKIEKATLIGHSIAGDELTWLGGHHPERFAALVYLDAAYDRSGDAASNARLRDLNRRLPPEPPIPPEALANHAAAVRFLAERGHVSLPEGELIAMLNMDKRFLAGTPAIEARVQQAIVADLAPPNYSAVKIPALAIYAIEKRGRPLPPWYDPDDADIRKVSAEIAEIRHAQQRANIERFQREIEHGRVIELRDASHYIMQSNARETLEAIESFLASP